MHACMQLRTKSNVSVDISISDDTGLRAARYMVQQVGGTSERCESAFNSLTWGYVQRATWGTGTGQVGISMGSIARCRVQQVTEDRERKA